MTLIAHARTELERLGEDPETTEGLLKVVQAFADMGHSGGSASICIPVINRLLRFQPLGPLTNDPREWNRICDELTNGKNLWQSARCPEAFSSDGGYSYTLLSEERRWIPRRLRRRFPVLAYPRHLSAAWS